jgi:peptide/nickel transport system substrate-binding protein
MYLQKLQSRCRALSRALVIGTAVIAVAGCTSAVKEAEGGQSNGEARSGGTLQVAQGTDAEPATFLNPSLGNLLSQFTVFETLTKVSTETGEPEPVVAESWELAPDGKSMTLELRDDVTYHSGRTLTSADVEFALTQMKDPALSPGGEVMASKVTGIETPTDTQVELTFSEPMPNIFDLFELMPLVDKETFDGIASGEEVVGTGRFTWESWTPGSKITLAKYEDHRDAANTALDGIDINIISDPTAELAAIKSGRVAYATGLAPLDVRSLTETSGFNLVKSGGSSLPLAFDVRKAPFDNKAVRQAVHYAIDRERINEQVQGGLGQATALPWQEATAGYDTSEGEQYALDIEKAKQLLSSAGVAEGTEFEVLVPDFPENVQMFEIVRNNLAAVGLEAVAKVVDSADYGERVSKGDMGTPAFLMRNGNGPTPQTQVQSRPELQPQGNMSHFTSQEYSDRVAALTSAVDAADVANALSDYDEYFLDEAFCLSLNVRPSISVRTDEVDGITSTQQGYIDLSTAYLTS